MSGALVIHPLARYNSGSVRYSGDVTARIPVSGEVVFADSPMARRDKDIDSFSSSIKLVERPDLVTHVTTGLRKHIVAGKLRPGSELPPEARLAESFGVSRTVIREAMRHLRSQGLVEVMRGRKPRVKAASSDASVDAIYLMLQRSEASLSHLLEVRRALESEIAALAAARATPEQLRSIVEANEELLAAITVAKRIECDWAFHERMAEASNNPLFVLLMKTIVGLFQESMRRTLPHSDVHVVYAEHAELIKAIQAKDVAAAQRIALSNLARTQEDLHGH